ncbi:MAG: DVUA0089 family protein, partial [Cyanobacteria bacterium J06623_7]
RVFDSEGNELAFNDDSGDLSSTATDSAIAFLPSAEGEYFIGVSSAGNFAYDPINGNTNLNFSGNRGISTGEYQLEVEVAPVAADNDPDNTISEAIATNLPPNSNNEMLSGEIAGELDVDFYQLELEAGEGVNLDLNTNGLDSELDSYLRLFDADGNELAADDNNDANFTANFSADSSLSFVADTPGSYYVGVGTSGNFNYDPVRGRSNFSTDVVTAFTTTGSYELGIEILEVEPDSDPDNAIAEVSDRNLNGSVSAEIEHPDDVDLYPLELGTGNGVAIELNTVGLDSELDSYLRLFDSLGNELTFDNDDDGQIAPDADSDTDSRLNFAPAAGGEYFIGVSSDGNREYDVVNGSNNFSPSTGFSSGAYELNINSAPIVADTDIDNTLDEAIAIELDSTPLTISDGISTTADLDIYQVNLNRGDTVGFDIDTAVDNRLDTIIKVFDSEGNELGINDDGSAPDENSNLDSYLEFTAFTTGAYYFGVSSFGNFDYDPLAGSNNFSNNAGSTTGFYDLVVTSIDRVNTISGTAMADDLDGTPQSDLISGLAGDDTITGAAEADNLAGGNGNDLLSGNNGDDLLHGGAGADTLVGGNGNDIIDGDRGTDRLVGNGGMDTFILRTNGGRSNITDFTIGTDKIALSSGIGFEDLVLTSAGRNTTISFAERQIGTLVGINPSSITATDFIAASDSL